MKIDILTLKNTILKKGYKWFTDRPNLIGIRSTMDAPDVFNDPFCLVWTQEKMPNDLSNSQKQEWLNKHLFVDSTGNKLKVDGNWGKNSQYAMDQYLSISGKERLRVWQITTDPGAYWLNHPLNKLGTAVLKPNQWIDCWSLGLHQGKSDHPALVQTGKITVFRDNDKDSTSEEGKEESGLFGINIHRSNASGKTMSIGKWSAGCQVFQVKADHDQLRAICELYKSKIGNKFTYTLLKEKDLS